MMSKTHIAIGAATALACTMPSTPEGCAVAVIGGVVGGIVADNDILDNDYLGDALFGQLLAAAISAAVLALDFFLNGGIVKSIIASKGWLVFGIIVFALLYFIGFTQPHRGFTHSFLALLLYSIAVGFIYEPLVEPFALGYASHLAIDLLNKRGIKLLFPFKFGICLGLCYADGVANKVLTIAGAIVTVIMLVNGLVL